MHAGQTQALATYLSGAALLSVYGTEVCPFLETLSHATIFLTLSLIFLVGFGLRVLLLRWVMSRPASASAPSAAGAPDPWRGLLVELAVWVLVGLGATLWNAWRYQFPLESGLKVLVGCLTLGAMGSTFLALQAEERIIRSAGQEPRDFTLDASKFVSLSTKFLIFIGSCLGLFAAVVFLLFKKDLDYALKHASATADHMQLTRAILLEILFVVGVLLGGSILIARQYARNLRLMFGQLQTAFLAVEQGQLSTRVPMVSHDEISLIALHTNKMIQGLKERERIKTIFGKYLSPGIAESIIQSEQGTELGGREVQAAILFTDIRNYTALSEQLAPNEVVAFLNHYFTKVVEAIHASGGVVDKFIGDAVMAVFGLNGSPHPSAEAVQAARAIRAVLNEVNQHFSGLPPIDNGVGIHFGPVIAGNIGSPQRLEYTVIGDAVNTASRLEGLCKGQARKILISLATYENLPETLQKSFAAVGEFELKGKAKLVPVFGA